MPSHLEAASSAYAALTLSATRASFSAAERACNEGARLGRSEIQMGDFTAKMGSFGLLNSGAWQSRQNSLSQMGSLPGSHVAARVLTAARLVRMLFDNKL